MRKQHLVAKGRILELAATGTEQGCAGTGPKRICSHSLEGESEEQTDGLDKDDEPSVLDDIAVESVDNDVSDSVKVQE